MELKPCPFCGGKELVRSVNGGVLPAFMDVDKQYEIFEKTPYVTSCELSCELCGAQVEGYAASNNLHDDLYEKAIKDCYEKWNRRANDGMYKAELPDASRDTNG